MAEATVKVHMKSVLRKIRMANRTQAAIWAVENGYGAEDLHPELPRLAAPLQRLVLRTRTLDHPGLEFPGFIMMAGWMCHHERAM